MKHKFTMKRTVILLCAILVMLSADIFAGEPVIPSLDGLPEVTRYTLKNGVKVLAISEELPRTEIYCTVGFGKLHEDSANAGTAELIAKQISLSGTRNYPGNELHGKLESVGGDIRISADWENIVIVIRVLSRHTPLALNILGDILKDPLFDDNTLGYSKKLVFDNFKREMDEPSNAGFVNLRKVIFNGKGYGAVLSEESVKSVTAAGLEKTWRNYAKGKNINIAVSSSVKRDELMNICEKEYSALTGGERELYAVDNLKLISELREKSKNIYLVPKDLEQATIIIGTIAPDIRYSGDYPLFLMNYILGGGSFNSRLMNEIRVKRGLAYSVFSLVRNRYQTGVFMSFAQTRNEEAANVLSLMKENITLMSEKPVTAEELNWAKESVVNSYVFNFATTSDILENYLQIEYNDLEQDYYRNYLKRINKVTPADIRDESGLLFNKGLVTVVVGNRNLSESLKKFGNVIILE